MACKSSLKSGLIPPAPSVYIHPLLWSEAILLTAPQQSKVMCLSLPLQNRLHIIPFPLAQPHLNFMVQLSPPTGPSWVLAWATESALPGHFLVTLHAGLRVLSAAWLSSFATSFKFPFTFQAHTPVLYA